MSKIATIFVQLKLKLKVKSITLYINIIVYKMNIKYAKKN